MTDKELYEMIEKDYQQTIKEISELTGLSVEEVDEMVSNMVNKYFNNEDDIFEDIINAAKEVF